MARMGSTAAGSARKLRGSAGKGDEANAAAVPARPAPQASPGGAGGRSLERILEGTLSALSRRGPTLLSMIDVCDAAGVSRATLYRYFSKKEDLLAAVGEYVTGNFVAGVKTASQAHADPYQKLAAVLRFAIRYTSQVKADRILEIEPGFILHSLKMHFPKHVAAFNEALSPVYDELDQQLGLKLNRLLISEALLRTQESTSLIPGSPTWNSLPDTLPPLLEAFIGAREKRRGKTRR